jgi:hypothetical protein
MNKTVSKFILFYMNNMNDGKKRSMHALLTETQ